MLSDLAKGAFGCSTDLHQEDNLIIFIFCGLAAWLCQIAVIFRDILISPFPKVFFLIWPQKQFLPYLILGVNFVLYMTFPSILPTSSVK